MIFPEHMEFRYYITPERKECFISLFLLNLCIYLTCR